MLVFVNHDDLRGQELMEELIRRGYYVTDEWSELRFCQMIYLGMKGIDRKHRLLFGKETKGLPEDLLKKYIDKTIRIPMRKTLRSLNLSNSVAIVLYDVLRQKNFGDLEEISSYFDE